MSEETPMGPPPGPVPPGRPFVSERTERIPVCNHKWADRMSGGTLGETYTAPSGTGTRLFQVCICCGMVRQVSS